MRCSGKEQQTGPDCDDEKETDNQRERRIKADFRDSVIKKRTDPAHKEIELQHEEYAAPGHAASPRKKRPGNQQKHKVLEHVGAYALDCMSGKEKAEERAQDKEREDYVVKDCYRVLRGIWQTCTVPAEPVLAYQQ